MFRTHSFTVTGVVVGAALMVFSGCTRTDGESWRAPHRLLDVTSVDQERVSALRSLRVAPLAVDRTLSGNVGLYHRLAAELERLSQVELSTHLDLPVKAPNDPFGSEVVVIEPGTLRREIEGGASDGSDALLYVQLLDYSDRAGGELAASAPARVSLRAAVVGIPEGELIWEGSFFFDDRELSANLLTIPKKSEMDSLFRWSSGFEVFSSGLAMALRSFERTRDQRLVN